MIFSRMPRPLRRRAFSIVELLIVVAILSVLLSILVPFLGKAKELARRAACISNLHHLHSVLHQYALDNTQKLPSGKRDDGREHCTWLSTENYEYLRDNAQLPVMSCPNDRHWEVRRSCGWRFGYYYLFGKSTPWEAEGLAAWSSPHSTDDDPGLRLVVEHIESNPVAPNYTVIPHTRGGRVAGPTGEPVPPEFYGSEGGNAIYLHGGASWTHQEDMLERAAIESLSITGWW